MKKKYYSFMFINDKTQLPKLLDYGFTRTLIVSDDLGYHYTRKNGNITATIISDLSREFRFNLNNNKWKQVSYKQAKRAIKDLIKCGLVEIVEKK